MKIKILTIVGVGLIGGSIGLAAKRRKLAEWVLGSGRRQASLNQALAVGAIDEDSLDLAAAVQQAEVAVFCTPVDQIAGQVLASASGCAAGTLLTDAGSTKAEIVRSVEGRLPQGVAFVGSHPLAGSEKRGAEHADADLFQNRLAIVTQTPATDRLAVERTSTFWRALGCRVQVMDPQEHDQALAITSHLPHLLAAALAGILPPELHELTASGFRDTTRIAAGDPSLWTAIFAQNRPALLAALQRLEEQLTLFREALTVENSTAVMDLLAQAKKVRDALGN
ncbi:MAG TPA: prephenate dehydrogenase/arogenate dehydrogenase family protein [Gemmataceae bacterium]|nr:prephenate dehydrogenase/arogenate dehydrogenase family protein [Gemmataceae bacterium]